MKSLNQPKNPFASYQVSCSEAEENSETVIFSDTRAQLKKAKHFMDCIAKANVNKAFIEFTWDDLSSRGVFVWFGTEIAADAFLKAYGESRRMGLSTRITSESCVQFGVWLSFTRINMFG